MHFITLWLQCLLLALLTTGASSMTRRHRNSRVDFTDDERNFLNLPANDDDRNNYNSHSQDEGNKSLSEGQQSQGDDVIEEDAADNVNSDDDDTEDQDDAVDPCEIKKCHRGRECHVARDGQAVCVCQRYCKKHRKLVCGTDGNLYLNHCQLHRAACLTGHGISIDRKNTCLKRKDFESLLQKAGGDLPKNSRVERVDKTFVGSSTATLRARTDDSQVVSTPLSASSSSSWDWHKKDDDSSMMALDGRMQQQQDAPCTIQEYELLKDNLLLYSHAKLMDHEDNGKKKNEASDKEYLVSIMFSHYDQNNNGMLEKGELSSVARTEHLDQLSSVCLLSDLVTFDDTDHDGKLSINEFYAAFSVSMVSLDKALETNHVIAHVGDNVEIKCDVTGSPLPPIIWRRNDVDLSTVIEDDIKVFVDGTLYLTRVQLVHAGNYTCHAQRNKDVVQTHVLHVETMPQVRVTPKIQSLKPGIEAKMDCHATGVPLPTVQWLKNDEDLKMSNQKYTVIGSGTELVVKKLKYSDTGAYMCVASNSAGSIRDISSLVVQDDPSPNGSPTEEKRFFVFHDWGVAVYEPTTCRLYHQIQGTDIIPGTQEYVCGDKGVNCSWGRAINVADRYVYVSQPMKDRVLIISKVQMVVVDVVVTDKFPVDLHYIPHLDQVWLLCWRASEDKGTNTIQIIRDASQKKKHHTVHPEPVDGQFDLVSNLFVPDTQDTGHKFRYGYAVHTNQRGMYKVDLAAMKYVRTVDLTPYNCVPNSAGFSSIGGLVVLECIEPITGRETGQLLLDYTTDSVISHKPQILGSPRVSPDSRNVVTVHRRNGSVTIVAQETTESGGLRFLFDVKTTLNISDATFYPSRTSHGYDLYASAVDKEDILFVNLVDGKVEMITGVGKAMPPSLTQWYNVNRPITSSGVFGNYMVTPAEEALFVVNGQTRTVNCEIGNLPHPRLVVWVTATL